MNASGGGWVRKRKRNIEQNNLRKLLSKIIIKQIIQWLSFPTESKHDGHSKVICAAIYTSSRYQSRGRWCHWYRVFEDYELVTWSLLKFWSMDWSTKSRLSSRLPSLSKNLPIATSGCFQHIFNDAPEEYMKRTKNLPPILLTSATTLWLP
jgi:hypothetical protein